jgi:hypothetical protein
VTVATTKVKYSTLTPSWNAEGIKVRSLVRNWTSSFDRL